MTTVLPDGVQLDEDVAVPMRDGTRLSADVYAPPGDGPFPVLVQRLPYNKQSPQTIVYAHPVWYARRGYIVVVQDCRGRFASEGSFYPFRGEGQDGYDTIEWAAQLERSNGSVGMYGFSYAGATQLMAAVENPPSLACIAPAFTAPEYFDGWTYRGGAFQLAFVATWLLQAIVIPDLLRQGAHDAAMRCLTALGDVPGVLAHKPLGQLPILAEFEEYIPYYADWVANEADNEYWQDLAVTTRLAGVRTPALHLGGWYDTFVAGTVLSYQTMSSADQRRLVLGPWSHMPWSPLIGDRDFGPQASNHVDTLQLEWFDTHLKGAPAPEGDPVRYFVMNADSWRSSTSWPPPGTEQRPWYLHSERGANSVSGDGQLRTDPPGRQPSDVFVFNPDLPVQSAGGNSCCDPALAPIGVACQREVEIRNDVLVYTSEALNEDVEIAGPVSARLFAASSGVDTDWTAKLVDVSPDGAAHNVCDGILRASHRDGSEKPTPITPNETYEYRIELGPTSIRFPAGHRIRLQISSSNFPAYDVNHNDGSPVAERHPFTARIALQHVFHDEERPSCLLLPVVGP